jgi:hypothetical protein
MMTVSKAKSVQYDAILKCFVTFNIQYYSSITAAPISQIYPMSMKYFPGIYLIIQTFCNIIFCTLSRLPAATKYPAHQDNFHANFPSNVFDFKGAISLLRHQRT